MTRALLITTTAIALSTAAAQALRAQEPRRLSFQAAGLYQQLTGNLKSQTGPGLGYEAQARLARRTWSLGVGVDYLRHERTLATFEGSPPTVIVRSADANFLGAFAEPRMEFADRNRSIRPYLVLRVGWGRATPKIDVDGSGVEADFVESPVSSFTWNGGVGLAMRVTGLLGIDAGVTGGLVRWTGRGDPALGGVTLGNGTTSTGNMMGRVGVSFGALP
jgi:hypothetical protein